MWNANDFKLLYLRHATQVNTTYEFQNININKAYGNAAIIIRKSIEPYEGKSFTKNNMQIVRSHPYNSRHLLKNHQC